MINQTFSFSHVPPVFKRGKHVMVAIFDRDNRLFLSRKNAYPSDVYRIFGGGIEGKELPLEAAKRELLEETNLDIAPIPVEVFNFTLKEIETGGKYVFQTHLYRANLQTKQIEPGDDVDGMRVFTKEDILELLTVYQELSDVLVTPLPEETFAWKDWGIVFGVIHRYLYDHWPQ